MPPKFKSAFKRKIKIDARLFKQGRLKGGAGNHPMVKSRQQMIAIAASQARKLAAGRSGGSHKKTAVNYKKHMGV